MVVGARSGAARRAGLPPGRGVAVPDTTPGVMTTLTPAEREHVEPISGDMSDQYVAWFREGFPSVITESGQVDFDQLRSLLGDIQAPQGERYAFSWAGKKNALRTLQTPTVGTLHADQVHSVNFETTDNAFIEGDNLAVLKLLHRSYFSKVKLIYIDPPYNTGNDLIYRDNFTDPLQPYLRFTGQKDQEGTLLTSNPETSGRYHSAWLSMMYPRLFLARQLLSDEGSIFVSIDDHEVYNLRMIMNEIFGEENFLGCVVRATGTTTGQDGHGFGRSFDYILGYSRNPAFDLGGMPLSEKDEARFNQQDSRGKFSLLQLRKTGNQDRREDRPLLYYAVKAPDGSDVFPIGPTGYDSRWRVGPRTYDQWANEDFIVWKQVVRNGEQKWVPYVKYYLEGREKRPSPLWTDIDGNKKATIEVKELLGDKIFSAPKPTALVRRLLEITTEPDAQDIVLDFFAGSGTTGQAVMDQNDVDDGNRVFICVQLPEPTPSDSPARKAGYADIAEIGRERIKRAGDRLAEEPARKMPVGGEATTLDVGFRAFKLAPSSMKPWEGVQQADPESYAQQMAAFEDRLVEGWSPQDVVWEVALSEGFSLTSRAEVVPGVDQNVVFRLTDPTTTQSLMICLDDAIDDTTSALLKLSTDDLFICRDSSLTDEQAANLTMQCRLKTI